MVYVCVRYE